MASNKFDYNGWSIWFEKYGCGATPLLLIPGAIGTGLSDFRQQLMGENAFNQSKYTLIAVELPGWGRSRPPIRPYGSNVFTNDAECCIKLMQHLGYDQFLVIGWSDGAKVALVMAVNHSQHIISAVLCAVITYASPNGTRNILSTKNIYDWDQQILNNYYEIYKDYEIIQQLWNRHMAFIADFGKIFANGICNNEYNSCTCSVLLIHGNRDPLAEVEQSMEVLRRIPHAKIHRFANGSHNLHQKYAKQFKEVVENFFEQNDGTN